jgi:hypothetical protein
VTPQRVVLAIAAALGMLCTFLPWVSAPFVGSVSGTRGDGWITFGLCAVALVIALAGNLRAELVLPAVLSTALIGVVVCLVAIWKIIEINRALPDEGIGAVVSVGSGLYLLAFSGVAIALLPSLVQSVTPGRQPPPPPPGWPPQQRHGPTTWQWGPPAQW